jgi:hypothetical protein
MSFCLGKNPAHVILPRKESFGNANRYVLFLLGFNFLGPLLAGIFLVLTKQDWVLVFSGPHKMHC